VREAMIESAWLVVAERGIEGMSTREVLARTGAPRASVYHYFPRGRTELIDRAEAAFNATSDALAEHFRQAGLTPDDARRRAMLLMYVAGGAVILAWARRSVEPLTFIAEQLSGSRSEASPGKSAEAHPGE
jgi:AcrR family transcriptional regulator